MKKLTLRIPTIDLLSSKKLKGGYTISLPEIIVYPPESPFDPPDDPRGDDPRNDPDDPRDDPDYPDHPDHPNPGDHGQNNSDNSGEITYVNLTPDQIQKVQDFLSRMPECFRNLTFSLTVVDNYQDKGGTATRGVVTVEVGADGSINETALMHELFHQLQYGHYEGIMGNDYYHSAIEFQAAIFTYLLDQEYGDHFLDQHIDYEESYFSQSFWNSLYDSDGFNEDFFKDLGSWFPGFYDWWQEYDPTNNSGYWTGSRDADLNWDWDYWLNLFFGRSN